MVHINDNDNFNDYCFTNISWFIFKKNTRFIEIYYLYNSDIFVYIFKWIMPFDDIRNRKISLILKTIIFC